MAGLFMLWRGVQMKEDWIAPWEQNTATGNEICLPTTSSCSQNLGVALGFAFKNPRAEYNPVLFAISVQNYISRGMRMNNEAYTAFPVEREILL